MSMKKLSILFLFSFIATCFAGAQTFPSSDYTTVTGTVIDGAGTTWANGTMHAQFMPNPQNPNIPYYINGIQLPTPLFSDYQLDSGGNIPANAQLFDNKQITPTGTQWALTFCSQTSAPCSTFQLTITGASMVLTPLISANITPISVTAPPITKAYNDMEVQAIPNTLSAIYYNVISNTPKYWNGASWTPFGSGSGGNTPPGTPVGAVQFNGAGAFGGDSQFTYNNVTHTLSTPTEINNAGTQFLSYMESIPRAEYDPLDPQFAGGLQTGQTPAQQTAVMDAIVNKSACDIYNGVSPAAYIKLPPKIPIILTHTELVYAHVKWGCPTESAFGGCTIRLQYGGSPVISTAGQAQLSCNGNLSVPSGYESVIENLTIDGENNGANDTGINVYDQHVLVANNSLGTHTVFGGPAITFSGLDSWLIHNYVQGTSNYYLNNSTGGQYVGAVQFTGVDSHAIWNEISDGLALVGGRKLTGTNPLNLACMVAGGANQEVADNLFQNCNVGLINTNTSAFVITNNRFDGMSGPAIMNQGGIAGIFSGNRMLWDCLDPTTTNNPLYNSTTGQAGCSLFMNYGGSSNNLVTETQYSLSNGLFGTSNFISEFYDGATAGAANKFAANETLFGKTYTGSALIQENLLSASDYAEVDMQNVTTTNSTGPNVAGVTTLISGDNTPTNWTTFHGAVVGQRVAVIGGNSNTTIINTPGGSSYGNMAIHTTDGQNINLGNIQGRITFVIDSNGINQEGSNFSAYAHLNQNGVAASSSPDIVDVNGNGSFRPIANGLVYANVNSGSYGTATCYIAQATVGTGLVTEPLVTSSCTSITPSTGTPAVLFLGAPMQYSNFSIYRYSVTSGGLNTGLLASYGAGQMPGTFTDTGANATGTYLPTPGFNSTGFVNADKLQISDYATPTVAPPGTYGLNVNLSGLTYWNGSNWVTISGGGGGAGTLTGTGLSSSTFSVFPMTSSPTNLTNSPLSVVSGVVTSSDPIGVTNTTLPSSIVFLPDNIAPSVTANAATWGIPQTITTAGYYQLPTAPGTGFWFGTNSSGIVTDTFVGAGTVYGTCPGCATPPASTGVVNSGTANQLAYYGANGSTVSGETLFQASNMPALTGDVTSPGGSLATTVGKVNGGTIPASVVLASNASSQLMAATNSQINNLLASLTGCNTAGYVLVPASGNCVANSSAGTASYQTVTSTLGTPAASQATFQFSGSLGALIESFGANTSTGGSVALVGQTSNRGTTDYYMTCTFGVGCNFPDPLIAGNLQALGTNSHNGVLTIGSNNTALPNTPSAGNVGITIPITGITPYNIILPAAPPASSSAGYLNCTNATNSVCSWSTASGGSQTYPAAGIMVSTGSAFGTSLTAPAGTIVGTTDTQTLTNKTLDGVSPTTMGYVDATSSIQTQLNSKLATASQFISSITTTGTSGPATVSSGVLNIPQYSGGGSSLPSGTAGQNLFYAAAGTTASAGSAILESSTGTTGLLQFGGVESHFRTGPTSSTTINAAYTTSSTSITVVSTTGYPACSTVEPCYLVLAPDNYSGEIVSATGSTSTTFTGLTRALFGTTAGAQSSGYVNLISNLIADSTSVGTAKEVEIWGGDEFFNVNATIFATGGNLQNGSQLVHFGVNGLVTGGISFGGAYGISLNYGGILLKNPSATAVVAEDQYGIRAGLQGTAIASASTIAPVAYMTHITGTTAINTITVPSSGDCVTGLACQIVLIPDALWTTGTTGNIALATTAVVKKALILTYDATTAKWYPSY